MLRYANQSR